MNKILPFSIINPLDLAILLTLFYMIFLPLSTVVYEITFENPFLNFQGLRIIYLKIYYTLIFFLCFWSFFRKDNIKNFQIYEVILTINIALVFYFYISSSTHRLMFIISIIMMFSLYYSFKNISVDSKIINLSIAILLFFLLTPIFFYPFQGFFYYQFNFADSFRGFSSSRTDYGYLTSIVIILLIVSNIRPKLRALLIATAFIPLAMAQSRAAILSVFGSIIMAIYWCDVSFRILIRRWFLPIIICLFFLLIITLFSFRLEDLFADRGGRLELWSFSIDRIKQNPWFGAKDYYQQLLPPGFVTQIEPHNSILQSLLNFGLIGTIAWYLLIGSSFFQCAWRGKIFLVNWFLFGMFHTSLDAYLFVPENLITLLLAVRLGLIKSSSPILYENNCLRK